MIARPFRRYGSPDDVLGVIARGTGNGARFPGWVRTDGMVRAARPGAARSAVIRILAESRRVREKYEIVARPRMLADMRTFHRVAQRLVGRHTCRRQLRFRPTDAGGRPSP
jgi:hypothetical protein